MADERTIPVYALNIAANPHPSGIYLRLLTQASKYAVPAHGRDFSRITEPRGSPADPGVYSGNIFVWTDINTRGRWYDISTNSDLAEELKQQIHIPGNAKPNFRVFDYVFNEKKHRLYFEATNEFGETLGPATMRRVMRALMAREIQGLDSPDVEVTLVPRAGAVATILKMSTLRKLTIRVVLPNPDTTDPQVFKRVKKRLDDAKARQLDEEYRKQAKAPRLVPTKEIRDTAAVAAENGFVRGEGIKNGKPFSLSTADIPRLERILASAGTSLLSRLRATVGLF